MKKTWKAKRILALALGATFIVGSCGLVACGGEENNEKTISYAVWGNTEELEIINTIVSGFESLYVEEGYKVELEHYPSNYYNNVQLSFSGKKEADVLWMQGGSIESYIRDDLLLNLQSYIEKEYDDGIEFSENDLWAINDGYRYDDKNEKMGSGDLYSIVKDWSPDFAMVFNKDLIDEFNKEEGNYSTAVKQEMENKLAKIATDDPQYASLRGTKVVGRTLADIVGYPTDESGVYPSSTIPMSWKQNELMCFLLTTYNSSGLREIYGTILDNDALKFAQMQVEMNGESLYSEDNKKFNYSTADSNSPTALELREAYQHFINYQNGALASTGTFGTSSVSSDSDFPKGNVAVVWFGRWKFAKATWKNINFGLAPPPTKDGGVDANNDGVEDNGNVYCSSVAVGLSISNRSKNKELAWKFIRYYMTVGTRTTLSKGFNLPGNKTIAKSEAFLNTGNTREDLLNNWYVWLAEKTHPLKFTKYVDNSVPDGYLKTYLTSASKGSMTVDEALRSAGNKINEEINIALE